eukprot:scaffold3276_cov69-Cyclotella_meneghiniana.AAC.2
MLLSTLQSPGTLSFNSYSPSIPLLQRAQVPLQIMGRIRIELEGSQNRVGRKTVWCSLELGQNYGGSVDAVTDIKAEDLALIKNAYEIIGPHKSRE